MNKQRTLQDFAISGIGSMIRNLSLLSADPYGLENEIQKGAYPLNPSLFYDCTILDDEGLELAVGDVVLFRLGIDHGAYPSLEALWGPGPNLVSGHIYIGALCERLSSKLFTAEFETTPHLGPTLDLQLIGDGGGIGWATGYSPSLENKNGSGVPADVEIIGVVSRHDNHAEKLNIILHTALAKSTRCHIPHILCVGTGTDVGKTTLAASLLREFSRNYCCAAIKASGTGGVEDSRLHMNHGALLGLDYVAAGLPTTYNLPSELYLSRIGHIVDLITSMVDIPPYLFPPDRRWSSKVLPELLFIEHGGDLIEAGIPDYLSSNELMQDVVAIVVCSESALSLRGALAELRNNSGRTDDVPVFANMPLVNPQGFMRRVDRLFESGSLAGIIDVNKPVLISERDRRLQYARFYNRVLSPTDLVHFLSARLSDFSKMAPNQEELISKRRAS